MVLSSNFNMNSLKKYLNIINKNILILVELIVNHYSLLKVIIWLKKDCLVHLVLEEPQMMF